MSQIVGNGTLRNRQENKLYPYEMRLLDMKNIEEIMSLQYEILSAMKDTDVCVAMTDSEVTDILNGLGEMVGVFVDNTLVAVGASLFPGDREDNLGRDIDLCDAELMKVAHLEFAAVHPLYRGNSLQKIVAGYLVKSIAEAGRFEFILNTISPLNPVSLDTGFYLGLHIRKLLVKYGGLIRYILFCDTKNPVITDSDTLISVHSSDFIKQQELLELGYYGIGFENGLKSGHILFGKVVRE